MRIGIAGVIACLALVGVVQWRAQTHFTRASFWFEDVSFDSSQVQAPRLGVPLTATEIERIRRIARDELTAAFAGFRVLFSDDRHAMYTVRVVQSTKHPPLSPFHWSFESAGESRVVRRFGGQGIVNFRLLANYAIMHAPAGAERATIIRGIGRGIGRAAAHEFAHLFLASESIHATRDPASYEYPSADRPGQYYGPMHWDIAGRMLETRLGRKDAVTASLFR